jgi:penicillin amidase
MDTSDLVRLELEPGHPRRYRTPAGWREFERIEEILQARGGTNLTLTIEETIWGPVIAVPGLPGKYALACTAHDPQALNLRLFDLARARDAETALRLAPVTGVPVNNFLVGDGQGNIGYTLIGRLPERFGFDGVAPVSWADGTCGWRGLLPPERYPRVLNPPDGCLWTANNRVLGTPEYLAGHPDEYDPGARAALIRNDLRALRGAVETNLWAIYLNDRALFLERWQQLLLSVLDRGSKTNTRWRELRDYVANWGGRAAAESQGYRFVRAFRHQTHELLFAPLNQRLGVRVGNEDAAWTLLTERPQHLLNPQFARFDDLLAEAVQRVLADLQTQNLPLAQATWGQRNVLRMQHPLSRAVPFLARWLDLPVVPMPGDDHMPRVYVSEWRGGVSERLVVSPGREEQGLFNMPGGQSGHFLSPFYQAGHAAWLKGEPLPLLPGPARHTLILRPVRGT